MAHSLPFANVFAPFTPFWIRKPVPVLPSAMQFPSLHHHSSHHHAHSQNFNSNCGGFNRDTFNLINFRANSAQLPSDGSLDHLDHKAMLKKQFYDSPAMQTIKSELFSASGTVTPNHSSKALFDNSDHSFHDNSYDDENDFNDPNIDVESDSSNDQPLKLKQESNYPGSRDYNEKDEILLKNEEWNRIMKNTMLLNTSPASLGNTPDNFKNFKEDVLNSSQSSSPVLRNINDCHKSKSDPTPKSSSSNNQLDLEDSENHCTKIRKTCQNEEEENEYYNDTFTESNLLNLSERKRGKYANGFSIENLIGRIVEDR